jgi:hypothetical protein
VAGVAGNVACGSMELSYTCFWVFGAQRAQKPETKKIEYRSAEG